MTNEDMLSLYKAYSYNDKIMHQTMNHTFKYVNQELDQYGRNIGGEDIYEIEYVCCI